MNERNNGLWNRWIPMKSGLPFQHHTFLKTNFFIGIRYIYVAFLYKNTHDWKKRYLCEKYKQIHVRVIIIEHTHYFKLLLRNENKLYEKKIFPDKKYICIKTYAKLSKVIVIVRAISKSNQNSVVWFNIQPNQY